MQVPNEPFSKFFKEKVSLSQKDIMEYSETVNNFIHTILAAVRERDAKFALRVLNTGNTDVIIKDLKRGRSVIKRFPLLSQINIKDLKHVDGWLRDVRIH